MAGEARARALPPFLLRTPPPPPTTGAGPELEDAILGIYDDGEAVFGSADDIPPGIYRDSEVKLVSGEHSRARLDVDPGRVNPITLVRHVGPGVRGVRRPAMHRKSRKKYRKDIELHESFIVRDVPTPPGASKSQKRKAALHRKLIQVNQQVYVLRNGRWRNMTHSNAAQWRLARRWKHKQINAIHHELSRYSRRSTDLGMVSGYIETIGRHLNTLTEEAFVWQKRKTRFHCSRSTQRALHQVMREVCGGRDPSDCFLLWGNGSFSPSFGKGSPSAPNKKFYRFFSRFLPVILCDERYTSKRSCCCDVNVSHPPHNNPTKRGTIRGISFCAGRDGAACGSIWSRDVGSALKIGNKAMHRMTMQQMAH